MRWSLSLLVGGVLPTIAAVLEQPLPKRKIDGVDAWKVISGESSEPVQEAYFFYYGKNNLEAMRMGNWKLVFPHKWRDSRTEPGKDGIPGKYHFPKVGLELYDLDKDLGETTNVAEAHPEVMAEMQRLAEGMRSDLGDGLTKKKPSGARQPGRFVK